MAEEIKEALIKKGIWYVISKVYDKLALALILFLAAEGWGQYKQVDTNKQAITSIQNTLVNQAELLAEEKESREELQVSFDSLLHCLGKKHYRDSLNMRDINKALGKILKRIEK